MKVKFILPALTEASGDYWRPIKYSLFPPLGLATLAAYLEDSDEAVIADEHVQTVDQAANPSYDPPDPADRPNGCPFHPRCPAATTECAETHPNFETVEGTRVRCLHAPEATGESDDDRYRRVDASAKFTGNDD